MAIALGNGRVQNKVVYADAVVLIERRVHSVINKFADLGLHSLAVAYQDFPEGKKESLWNSPFDPQRHDCAETIRRAINLGANVKLITGDQLEIGKETGRRLCVGTNMYPSSSSIVVLPIDELIEKADGFDCIFLERKYDIVKHFQARKHKCGMTGDGFNDALALKKTDIVAADAIRSVSDILLTEPGFSVFISVMLCRRANFQRMKNIAIYAVSITIWIVLGFMLLVLKWKFDIPPLTHLIIAILNGDILEISTLSLSERKYEIVKCLQAHKHICGMTGDGVIGIAVAGATHTARSESDILLMTKSGHSVYAISFTIWIVFDYPPFMVLIIASHNDGIIMTPLPDSWKDIHNI